MNKQDIFSDAFCDLLLKEINNSDLDNIKNIISSLLAIKSNAIDTRKELVNSGPTGHTGMLTVLTAVLDDSNKKERLEISIDSGIYSHIIELTYFDKNGLYKKHRVLGNEKK